MSSRNTKLLLVVACLGAGLWPRAGAAHAVGKSSLQLELTGPVLAGSWRLGAADLEPVLALDADADGRIDDRDLDRAAPAIGEYLASRLEVEAAGAPCPTRVTQPRLEGPDLVARVEARCESLAERDDLGLRYDLFFEHDTTHQGLLRLERGGATHSAVFTHHGRTATIPARAQSAGEALSGHLVQGIWHIAFGYDHLAFLLTLLLPAVLVRSARSARSEGDGGATRAGDAGARGASAPGGGASEAGSRGASEGRERGVGGKMARAASARSRVVRWWSREGWQPLDAPRAAWVRVLRVVTAFTLAHSLTLSLAALGVVRPPERLIEVVIAASVVLAALDNLLSRGRERSHWLAFLFGLVHGFGFANALGELGLPRGHELLALFGFNLGVELGQLAVVLAVLPLALVVRRGRGYVPWVLRGGSAAIAAVALMWLIERTALAPDAVANAEASSRRELVPGRDRAPAAGGSSGAPLPPGLARLAERWSTQPASGGYQPFFRPRIAQRILLPALADAAAVVRATTTEDGAALAPHAGRAQGETALAALEHGDPDPAIAWLDAVASARDAANDRGGAARAHAARGVLIALGDPVGAAEALSLATALDARHAHAALWLATLEARLGRLERAEATLGALLARLAPPEGIDAAAGADPVARADVGAGADAADARHLAAGLAAPDLAADPDEAVRAAAWSLLADVLAHRKRWPEAERALESSLRSNLALGDRASAADDHRRLADVTLALARARDALEHFERAIELARSLGDGDVAALAADHRNAAAVAQLLDDLPVAARLYRRALELDERQAHRERVREDLVRLSQVYRRLDQLDEARACLERALAIDEASGSTAAQAEDLVQLGNLHQLADQLALAEAFYTRALASPGLRGDMRADVRANLGNVLRRRGDAEGATALYRSALSDYRAAREASKAARVEQYLAGLEHADGARARAATE